MHAGPNAVLALAREGYDWRTLQAARARRHAGLPRVCSSSRGKHWRYGLGEMHRSLSKRGDGRRGPADAARRHAPTTCSRRRVARRAGVRAQAVRPDGIAGRRLPVRRRTGTPATGRRCCTCSTRPRPRPPRRCRSAGRSWRRLARRRSVDARLRSDGFRSGFACFVGRPNAGKSTLTNALIGSKVAITSSRPQTTRHAIRGIVHRADAQLIVVDTPGLHKPRTLLGEPAQRRRPRDLGRGRRDRLLRAGRPAVGPRRRVHRRRAARGRGPHPGARRASPRPTS